MKISCIELNKRNELNIMDRNQCKLLKIKCMNKKLLKMKENKWIKVNKTEFNKLNKWKKLSRNK